MKLLVTGSSGHLGEALVKQLRVKYPQYEIVGIDISNSGFTTHIGSITDRKFVKTIMIEVSAVFHTAGLHKPHLGSHSRQDFVDVNIFGTLVLLEEAVNAGVKSFIFTSTTSVYGDALSPPPGAPAAWITEDTVPKPKNIYGVTKLSAENLCLEFHRNCDLACTTLRVSRFFPNEDDSDADSSLYCDDNIKVNEFFYRRVEIQDVVDAHVAAFNRPTKNYRMFVISSTTPFTPSDAANLRINAEQVLFDRQPQFIPEYQRLGWKMFPSISRVYVSALAQRELDWNPTYTHSFIAEGMKLNDNFSWRSPLCLDIGVKGYHRSKPDTLPDRVLCKTVK